MDLHDELACVLFMRVKCMLSLARDEFMLIVSSVEVRLSVLTRVTFSNETPQQVGQRERLSSASDQQRRRYQHLLSTQHYEIT